MITHELLRELLNDDLKDIQDIAEFVPNEIVYRALVIREFMKERSITDVREGIRLFYAFERERLQRLGLVDPQDNESKMEKSKTASSAAP